MWLKAHFRVGNEAINKNPPNSAGQGSLYAPAAMWAHFGCGSVAQLLTESKWISQGGFSLHSRCIVPSHDGQLTSCSSTGFAKFILNRMWKYQRPEKLNKSSLSIPEWRPMPVKSFTDLTLSVYKLHQRPAWIVSWSLVTKIVVSKVKTPASCQLFKNRLWKFQLCYQPPANFFQISSGMSNIFLQTNGSRWW